MASPVTLTLHEWKTPIAGSFHEGRASAFRCTRASGDIVVNRRAAVNSFQKWHYEAMDSDLQIGSGEHRRGILRLARESQLQRGPPPATDR